MNPAVGKCHRCGRICARFDARGRRVCWKHDDLAHPTPFQPPPKPARLAVPSAGVCTECGRPAVHITPEGYVCGRHRPEVAS